MTKKMVKDLELAMYHSVETLPRVVNYYMKNEARIDNLSKSIILNSLLRGAFSYSNPHPELRRRTPSC